MPIHVEGPGHSRLINTVCRFGEKVCVCVCIWMDQCCFLVCVCHCFCVCVRQGDCLGVNNYWPIEATRKGGLKHTLTHIHLTIHTLGMHTHTHTQSCLIPIFLVSLKLSRSRPVQIDFTLFSSRFSTKLWDWVCEWWHHTSGWHRE